MRMIAPTHKPERAFTIVEVIIAALIVTMVFAGAVYFMTGAGKSQQSTLVRQRMAASADAIVQKVRADRTWVTEQCKTAGCTLTDARFQPARGNSRGPELAAQVRVTPVDSDGDGQGPADEDGVRPDFYRIQVRVALRQTPGRQQEREWGEHKPFETVSTVDATALGVATGVLVVQTGETSNQVDDRMAISSVTNDGDRADMRRQPEPCSNPFPITFDEWVSRRPILPLGCNQGFDAARGINNALAQVHLRAVNDVPFRIERVNTDGVSSTSLESRHADGGGAGPNGTYTFSGLRAGSYRIIATPPNNRELWRTKMLPSDGIASVQANQKARALVMVRPTQGSGQYRVQLTRQVYLYKLVEERDSVVGRYTQAGVTVEVTTNYVYLVADGPRRERWAGPAWNGLMTMEPKPFDRYRPSGTRVGAAAQNTLFAPWSTTNLFQVPSSHPNKDGWWTFQNLPTGLHSSPEQQQEPRPIPQDSAGMWDRFDADDPQTGWRGSRTQSCNAALTPGGRCDRHFTWLSAQNGTIGRPNSDVRYYSPEGECYLESSVAGAAFARRLQNGAAAGARCDRDFIYRNEDTGQVTRIPDFLPDKHGNGGGRMVLRMWQTSRCVANCGDSSTRGTAPRSSPEPTSKGPRRTVGRRNKPAPRTPKEAPPVTITRKHVDKTGKTQTTKQTVGAAPMVAMPSTK